MHVHVHVHVRAHVRCLHRVHQMAALGVDLDVRVFLHQWESLVDLLHHAGRQAHLYCVERRAVGTANDATASTATTHALLCRAARCQIAWATQAGVGMARHMAAQHASMPSGRRSRCYQSRPAASDSARPARHIGRRRETASPRGSRASAAMASQPRLPCDYRRPPGPTVYTAKESPQFRFRGVQRGSREFVMFRGGG